MITDDNKDLLIQGIINQIEVDLEEGDFDAIDEMLSLLLKNKDNQKILISFLGDTIKELWLGGKLEPKYFTTEK